MRAPYASRAFTLHALNALCIGFIAAYRGELYAFPASAWALSAFLGCLGLFAPLVVPARARNVLIAGTWPLVIVLAFVALVLSPRLLPSPLTVGPFFFCAGVSLATCGIVLWNTTRRKRSVRRALEHPDAFAPEVGSWLRAYFEAGRPGAEESSAKLKAVQRALRAQAWVSTRGRRARAVTALRELADFFARRAEGKPPVPPPGLFADAEDRGCSSEPIVEDLRRAAAQLESGRRIVRWRSRLISVFGGRLGADRDGFDAIDCLARRHAVVCPPWFRASHRALARLPLTATDVAPPWQIPTSRAKPVTGAIALVAVASVALSTASAQAPLDDARPLPVVAGPSGVSRIEPRLSRVAGALAGRKAEARCWSRDDWARLAAQQRSWIHRSRMYLGPWSAYASQDRKRAHFAPNICVSLSRLLSERIPVQSDRWPAALAWSVAVLAHEAQHLSGISNEAKAECYGMQSITTAAELLGRTADEGHYLASLYWRSAYHRHRDPRYIPDECRNGGRLDLRPRSDAWP